MAAFVEGRAWFRCGSGAPLAVAGLYRFAGDGRRRATMLTRPAGEAVAPFHERMPVILPAGLLDPWLAGERMPVDELLAMPVPLAVEPFPAPVDAHPRLFDP
ncbi:MAG: SOS response-associated peptidase family protein [Acidimicrobiia bacterium]